LALQVHQVGFCHPDYLVICIMGGPPNGGARPINSDIVIEHPKPIAIEQE
jgi:hypothetical protein